MSNSKIILVFTLSLFFLTNSYSVEDGEHDDRSLADVSGQRVSRRSSDDPDLALVGLDEAESFMHRNFPFPHITENSLVVLGATPSKERIGAFFAARFYEAGQGQLSAEKAELILSSAPSKLQGIAKALALQNLKDTVCKAMVLIGPSGGGKSASAKAIAIKSRRFYAISCLLMGCWIVRICSI